MFVGQEAVETKRTYKVGFYESERLMTKFEAHPCSDVCFSVWDNNKRNSACDLLFVFSFFNFLCFLVLNSWTWQNWFCEVELCRSWRWNMCHQVNLDQSDDKQTNHSDLCHQRRREKKLQKVIIATGPPPPPPLHPSTDRSLFSRNSHFKSHPSKQMSRFLLFLLLKQLLL